MPVPFDPTNAPPGYRAVPNPGRDCRFPDGTPCALRRPGQSCLMNFAGSPEFNWNMEKSGNSCLRDYRPDQTEALFAKDLYGNEEDP